MRDRVSCVCVCVCVYVYTQVKPSDGKQSEFYKLLASKSEARRPAQVVTDDSPSYNQWGEKVTGFIGPLPSPGSTPILSFVTQQRGMPQSPGALLSSNTTPRQFSRVGADLHAPCQSPSSTPNEFACRGVVTAHSPMCIYHKTTGNDDEPPELAI